MDKKKTLLIYTAMLFAMIFWGMSFVWTKMVFAVYKPITTIFLRLVISSVFLWILGLIFNYIKRLAKEDIKKMMLLTLFQPFMYFIGENLGLSMVSSTVAAVIVSTIPLFSPVASYMFFQERITAMNVLGIIVSIIGVFLTIIEEDFTLRASPIGILLLFLAVVSAIAYSVYILKLSDRYNPYSIITYQNTFGVIFFLPVFLIFDFEHFMNAQPTFESLSALIQLSVFASSLAFMLFTYGVHRLGVTKANAVSNIIPVFTAIFSYILLGEVMSYINMIGVLTVVTGLFLSQLQVKLSLKPKKRV